MARSDLNLCHSLSLVKEKQEEKEDEATQQNHQCGLLLFGLENPFTQQQSIIWATSTPYI
jgi:hypothetical protein